MKYFTLFIFILIIFDCNYTKGFENRHSLRDLNSIDKTDKDSIKILVHTETKVDTFTEIRTVFLDYKKHSEYKNELYNIRNKPLDPFWSKEIYRPEISPNSKLVVNPFNNLKKTFISISKLNGSYILFSQGQESLTFTVAYVGDTTLTRLDMEGWFVDYFNDLEFKNDIYKINIKGPFQDSTELEIKVIDKKNDIQIWKTTATGNDKIKHTYYELKAPFDYALGLPILVISNSLGLDTDYDGIDNLDLEKMFNK